MEHIGTILEELYDVVSDRKVNPKPGAYTTYLFDKGIDKICKKILEEATETILSAKNEDREQLISELADVLYHLNVLLVEEDITWTDVAEELRSRRD